MCIINVGFGFLYIYKQEIMINPNLLTDELAEKMAGEAIRFHMAAEAGKALQRIMINELKEILKEDDKKQTHDALFNALFKAISPFEKKFGTMLKRIWGEERRILVANIKKMKKAWLQKDKIDDVMYPVAIFEKKLANGATGIFIEVMDKEGPRVVSLYDFDMIFDVNNPEVQKWLKSYTPMFSKKLEEVSVEKLRAELIEGMNAGEGVPELLKRVNTTYANWDKVRSETIARTEVIRASNQAALNVYRQSGVVTKKIWVTYHDARTCPSCELLDGKIIGLEQNYFSVGDPPEVIEQGGKKFTFDNSYTDIDAPPRHALCRCSISAYIED